MAYRNKYLKYKTKYLELTNTLRGGVKPALTPLIFGNDTKFIIFQDEKKNTQLSPINTIDELPFVKLLAFRQENAKLFPLPVFIYETLTHIYINSSKPTYIHNDKGIKIGIDVIMRISQKMEVAYLFVRQIARSELSSFSITENRLFKEIFENVELSLTNELLKQILVFLFKNKDSINCILYKEEIIIGLSEITEENRDETITDLPLSTTTEENEKKIIIGPPVNTQFIIYKTHRMTDLSRFTDGLVEEIKLERVSYPNDKAAFIELSNDEPSKVIGDNRFEFLYLRVPASISITMNEESIKINVIIRISQTAQVSYLCEPISNSSVNGIPELILFNQILEQVKLSLTKVALNQILLFCRNITGVLHKEQITIGLYKPIQWSM